MSAKKATKTTQKKAAHGGCSASTCSRFPAARIEELLQARDSLAEGDEISHKDACDLVNWYADELDRVRNAYQSRIGDLMIEAMGMANSLAEAIPYPENVEVTRGEVEARSQQGG